MSSSKTKYPIIRKSTKQKLIREALGSLPLPIIGGPELYDLITDLQRSRGSMDEKIDEASESLKKASELVDEIEQILTDRTTKLAVLKQEVERFSKLSEVEEENAKAIVQQLELTLNKGKNQERWVGFVINIVAGLILFVVGVVLSPALNQWLGINQPSPPTPQTPEQKK
jgi:predicted nuclease with TOPRIM domain